MRFTEETFKRALRTFLQAAFSYLLVSLAAIDFTEEGEALKTILLGSAVSALSAGLAAVMNLEKPKDMGGGEFTFKKWAELFEGKKINPDGVYGVQCVDLIKHYCRNVIGINKKYSDTWGNAVEWYTKYGEKPWLIQNFKRISYMKGMRIKKGDIAVFSTSSPYGHIAVCTGKYNSNSFEAFDENYKGTGAGMTKRNFEYSGSRMLLGVLRPRDRSNISSPPVIREGTYKITNVRGIYSGWGASTGRKKVCEISEDAKKHTVCKKNNAEAFLEAGTRVTVKEMRVLESGNLWAKIPSGYICIWEEENGKTFVRA